MTTVIIDYGSGNLRSAAKAFERAARDADLFEKVIVSARAEDVAHADRIVLPGVGSFADCMAGLTAIEGLNDALVEAVQARGKPFLGICVGMQLMATEGIEFGHHAGLDWVEGQVVHLEPQDPALKIPHMGWNEIAMASTHPVFQDLGPEPHVYFVHSYHFEPKDPACIVATAAYGQSVTAAIAKDNMIGTQFHPEKSQRVGLKLIENFLRWSP